MVAGRVAVALWAPVVLWAAAVLAAAWVAVVAISAAAATVSEDLGVLQTAAVGLSD